MGCAETTGSPLRFIDVRGGLNYLLPHPQIQLVDGRNQDAQ